MHRQTAEKPERCVSLIVAKDSDLLSLRISTKIFLSMPVTWINPSKKETKLLSWLERTQKGLGQSTSRFAAEANPMRRSIYQFVHFIKRLCLREEGEERADRLQKEKASIISMYSPVTRWSPSRDPARKKPWMPTNNTSESGKTASGSDVGMAKSLKKRQLPSYTLHKLKK